MEPREIISESAATLTVNKIRTGLAMLGVVIGIGSVIALMSLGQASQKSITDRITSLGANLLTVRPGAMQSGGIRSASARDTLTLEDAEAILTSIDAVEAIAPLVNGNAQLVAKRNNTNATVYGVTDDYQTVNNVTMASGTFVTDRHNTAISRVVVLGPDLVTDLFGEGTDPVGQNVRFNGQTMQVIGVTASRGGSGFNNQDSVAFVPLKTAQALLFGQNYLSSLGLKISDETLMTEAETQVERLLLARHQMTNPDEADFMIMNQEDLLATVTETTGTFTTLLAGIAAISLVVGGIGIMNIMLVTVTERTREIGLRKALGAKKKVIIQQFLTEATLITVIGGVVGVRGGMGVSLVIAQLMSLAFTINSMSILLAFGVSVAIGIIFGWYPAKKAANLQPIEALRYE
ncbi:hypothetical protein A2W24_03940 [Microgenomates group bacterium RBG_16_45_19]|nr:MAG: hypothetical protein A2W24_03940 [Microgenomates group bacterium RBG_16_45_19]